MVIQLTMTHLPGEAVVKSIGWQFQSPLVVVILISTVLWAIMAISLSLPVTFRLRMREGQSQRITELYQRLQETQESGP